MAPHSDCLWCEVSSLIAMIICLMGWVYVLCLAYKAFKEKLGCEWLLFIFSCINLLYAFSLIPGVVEWLK